MENRFFTVGPYTCTYTGQFRTVDKVYQEELVVRKNGTKIRSGYYSLSQIYRIQKGELKIER